MSLLKSLFRRRPSQVEVDLYSLYVAFLVDDLHLPIIEAKEIVAHAIEQCKHESRKAHTYNLLPNLGDTIIEGYKEGYARNVAICKRALNDGATENDIRDYWNLDELQRRMAIWSENTIRLATYKHLKNEEHLNPEQAALKVRQLFPIYGNPEDTSILNGDDRPLPYELRKRVDNYRKRNAASILLECASKYSSFNALVRSAIRTGQI